MAGQGRAWQGRVGQGGDSLHGRAWWGKASKVGQVLASASASRGTRTRGGAGGASARQLQPLLPLLLPLLLLNLRFDVPVKMYRLLG